MASFNQPLLNATLNGLAGLMLLCGWFAIKRKNRQRHKQFMIMAFVFSTLFLISYVTYHVLHPGVTRYQHDGILRVIYFTILLTHTPLAALIVPFILMALYHAYKQNFDKHTRITRWLLPVWIYVSVTGVVIYLMLYVF